MQVTYSLQEERQLGENWLSKYLKVITDKAWHSLGLAFIAGFNHYPSYLKEKSCEYTPNNAKRKKISLFSVNNQ